MRLREIFNEARLRTDVPDEDWLEREIDYAKSKGRNRFGVPFMGTVTGYIREGVTLPVKLLASLPGARGEQNNVRHKDLEAIVSIMKDTGKLPIVNGHEYKPFITVAYDGSAWVNEGNHRIMAAAKLGWNELPVELRYFDGGERIKSGPLYPSKIGLNEGKSPHKKGTKKYKAHMEEGLDWKGTDDGEADANLTDHTFAEAEEYMKSIYSTTKRYRVRRAEPGFRVYKKGNYDEPDQKELNKSSAHITDVDSAIDYLKLKKNAIMSGSEQVTPSLGYSWMVYENRATGIGVLYYQDRGMGSDEIYIGGKDPAKHKEALQVFRDAGVIPTPKRKAKNENEIWDDEEDNKRQYKNPIPLADDDFSMHVLDLYDELKWQKMDEYSEWLEKHNKSSSLEEIGNFHRLFIKKLPIETVPMSKILAIEPFLDQEHLQSKNLKSQPPLLVKYQDKYVISDGNHRVARLKMNGENSVNASVCDVTNVTMNEDREAGVFFGIPAKVRKIMFRRRYTELARLAHKEYHDDDNAVSQRTLHNYIWHVARRNNVNYRALLITYKKLYKDEYNKKFPDD